MPPDAIVAEVSGFHAVVDRIPVLTRIHVQYRLRIPPGTRAKVDRALERHVHRCPTAQSFEGAIEVTWEAQIDEVETPGP